jgi:tRNA-Thr(GGU) m(6)t(6)A37 methyltransferase TsaA
MQVTYRPIGMIFSPFKDIAGMPIQPAGAMGISGTVEIYSEYIHGLQDLAGFSHVILLYHFHKATEARLIVTPFLDTTPRGVFSTRAPARPNSIGLSVVALKSIDHHILHILNVDILDQTPLLDIKPYVPEFDHHLADRIGWLEKAGDKVVEKTADDRFR